MAATGAARTPAAAPFPAQAELFAGLSRRQVAELGVPGAGIGLLGGVIAGILAATGGLSLAVTLVASVGLAIPLALAGAGYDILVARGRIPLGPLAPAALYWVVAFPLARVAHAAVVNLAAGDPVAVPHGWLDFVVYNALLSVGFAIGFWWLHQNYAPRWWWRLRDRNPVAGNFIREQLRFQGHMIEGRQLKRRERAERARGKRASSKRPR
jgi:hypothetical protein